MTPPEFMVPRAIIERIMERTDELADATTVAQVTAAIFLIHCQLKDIEESMTPEVVP